MSIDYVIYFVASCVEVYVTKGNDCGDYVPDQPNKPVTVCSINEEESKRVLLHCCPSHPPCVGWTSEWWYKDANKSDSEYKRYLQAGHNTAWVYVNNTDYPIRYLCEIMHGCEEGSGYIDIQRGA